MNVLASVATHLMTKPSQVVRERQIGQQSQNPLKVRVLPKLAGGEPRLPSETVSVGRRPKRSRNSAPIAGDTASAIPWSPPGDPRVRCMPWTGPPITQRTSGLGHTAKTRHQKWPAETGGRNGASIAKFRTRRPAHICQTSPYRAVFERPSYVTR
jgi:hypothetical protein